MLRKFIVVLLAVCMVSTSFVFAAATSMPSEYEESFFDALSYNNLSTVSAGNVGNGVGTFQLPSYMNMEYIDIIFHCLTFSSVGFGFNGTVRTNLSFVSLGSGYYRAYGTVDLSANRFDLIFSSQANYIYLDRVHIYSRQLLENQIAGGATIVAPGFSGTSISYKPTDNTNRRTWIGAAYSGTNTVSLQFYPTVDNWKGYDYLDYLIYLKLNSISSISCFFDGKAVPFEISEIFTGLDEDNVYLVNVRIDCRSLDRSLSQYPILQIHGFEYPNDTNVVDIYSISGLTYITNSFSFNYFFTRIWSSLTSGFNSLSSGIGSISTWIQTQTTSLVNAISSGIDSVGTWIQNQTTTIVNNFTSLKTSLSGWFTTLFSDLNDIKDSLSGSVEDGEQIQDNIDNSKEEMQDYKDAMESLPIPDIGDVDLDLDDNSGNAAITSVGRVLAIGINNEVTLPIFMLLFTFSMVGYALYGKR